MKLVLLTSFPASVIQLNYYLQTRGIKPVHIVCVGDGGPEYKILKDYALINDFALTFVPGIYSTKTEDVLHEIAPDLVHISTDQILPCSILSIPKMGTINTHMGILPDYRGLDSPLWAILEGGMIGGTVHVVDDHIDTGPLVTCTMVDRNVLPLWGVNSIRTLLTALHHKVKWQVTADAIDALMMGANPEPQREGHYFGEMPQELRDEVSKMLLELDPKP